MVHRAWGSNCELRNWEPARRVGVRRTISDCEFDKDIRQGAEGTETEVRKLEVGGALRLRLEANLNGTFRIAENYLREVS